MTVNDLIAYTLTLQDLLVCNDASTSEETSVEKSEEKSAKKQQKRRQRLANNPATQRVDHFPSIFYRRGRLSVGSIPACGFGSHSAVKCIGSR